MALDMGCNALVMRLLRVGSVSQRRFFDAWYRAVKPLFMGFYALDGTEKAAKSSCNPGESRGLGTLRTHAGAALRADVC